MELTTLLKVNYNGEECIVEVERGWGMWLSDYVRPRPIEATVWGPLARYPEEGPVLRLEGMGADGEKKAVFIFHEKPEELLRPLKPYEHVS